MQNFPIPYFSAFVIGFAYFLASAKTVEAFATVINEKLLLLILNLVLISVLVVMLRKFGGRSIKIGLIIGASLISGILLGYFVYSALSGGHA